MTSHLEKKQSFVEELKALMNKHNVIMDHNHDSESLDDGWHFFNKEFVVEVSELYKRN